MQQHADVLKSRADLKSDLNLNHSTGKSYALFTQACKHALGVFGVPASQSNYTRHLNGEQARWISTGLNSVHARDSCTMNVKRFDLQARRTRRDHQYAWTCQSSLMNGSRYDGRSANWPCFIRRKLWKPPVSGAIVGHHEFLHDLGWLPFHQPLPPPPAFSCIIFVGGVDIWLLLPFCLAFYPVMLILVLVLKDPLRTKFKSLSLQV